jgi:ankyrin repeat protein
MNRTVQTFTIVSLICLNIFIYGMEKNSLSHVGYDEAKHYDVMPLQVAACNGYMDLVKALINKKDTIDVNTTHRIGKSPLYLAAFRGHADIVRLLIGAHADVNKGHVYIHENNTSGILACYSFLKKTAEDNKASPLHIASEKGYKNIVEILLEAKADVNVESDSGATPLHLAVCNRRSNIVVLLIKAGADVNKVNKNIVTPLMVAVRDKNVEIARLLISAGANVNKRYPLKVAAEVGDLDMVILLLNAGAKLHRDSYKETAIEAASRMKHNHITLFLRSHETCMQELIDKDISAAAERAFKLKQYNYDSRILYNNIYNTRAQGKFWGKSLPLTCIKLYLNAVSLDLLRQELKPLMNNTDYLTDAVKGHKSARSITTNTTATTSTTSTTSTISTALVDNRPELTPISIILPVPNEEVYYSLSSDNDAYYSLSFSDDEDEKRIIPINDIKNTRIKELIVENNTSAQVDCMLTTLEGYINLTGTWFLECVNTRNKTLYTEHVDTFGLLLEAMVQRVQDITREISASKDSVVNATYDLILFLYNQLKATHETFQSYRDCSSWYVVGLSIALKNRIEILKTERVQRLQHLEKQLAYDPYLTNRLSELQELIRYYDDQLAQQGAQALMAGLIHRMDSKKAHI